jgi:hypothetical protein
MAAGVVHIPFYATLGRGDLLADALVDMLAPPSLRYGATRYSIQRSRDDRFQTRVMIWFNSKDAWYRFWEGPEAIEFRARYLGKYMVPLVYIWHDEIGSSARADASAHVPADVEIVS